MTEIADYIRLVGAIYNSRLRDYTSMNSVLPYSCDGPCADACSAHDNYALDLPAGFRDYSLEYRKGYDILLKKAIPSGHENLILTGATMIAR
ncbi:MAG: hypothetical protein ABIG84_03085 [archaeon]